MNLLKKIISKKILVEKHCDRKCFSLIMNRKNVRLVFDEWMSVYTVNDKDFCAGEGNVNEIIESNRNTNWNGIEGGEFENYRQT